MILPSIPISKPCGLLTMLLSLRCETDSSSVKRMSPRWMIAARTENSCETSCSVQDQSLTLLRRHFALQKIMEGFLHLINVSLVNCLQFHSPHDWSQWCQNIFELLQTYVCYPACTPSLAGFVLLSVGSWTRKKKFRAVAGE